MSKSETLRYAQDDKTCIYILSREYIEVVGALCIYLSMGYRRHRDQILQNIQIERIIHGGVGLATHSDGRKILVSGGALPGSIVDLQVIKSKKDYIQCHISHIHSIDPIYVDGDTICPHYMNHIDSDVSADITKKGCGGCKWQIMSYDRQLNLKYDIVQDCFVEILAKYPDLQIQKVIPSPDIFGYRNKIEFSFGKYVAYGERLSEWSLGFHKQGEFHKIVDIDQCYLIDSELNHIYHYFKNLLQNSGLDVYDQKRHKGVLRHLMLRKGTNTDQVMAVISLSDQHLISPNDLLIFQKNLQEDIYLREHINTMIISINNNLADTINSRDIDTKTLWGDGYIYEKLIYTDTSLTFQISPFSFFQTNTRGASKLFATAVDMLRPYISTDQSDYNTYMQDNLTVLDLYCGAGSIGLSMLSMGICGQVIGIDIVESSISDAIRNTSLNNLGSKTKFLSGKAEKLVYEIENLDKVGVIVVDPPREGLHPDAIKFLRDLYTRHRYILLYISCNPQTLARDIDMLDNLTPQSIQPVDMFPHTHHIENICVLV